MVNYTFASLVLALAAAALQVIPVHAAPLERDDLIVRSHAFDDTLVERYLLDNEERGIKDWIQEKSNNLDEEAKDVVHQGKEALSRSVDDDDDDLDVEDRGLDDLIEKGKDALQKGKASVEDGLNALNKVTPYVERDESDAVLERDLDDLDSQDDDKDLDTLEVLLRRGFADVEVRDLDDALLQLDEFARRASEPYLEGRDHVTGFREILVREFSDIETRSFKSFFSGLWKGIKNVGSKVASFILRRDEAE